MLRPFALASISTTTISSIPHVFRNSMAISGLPTGRYFRNPMLCTTMPLYTGNTAITLFLSIFFQCGYEIFKQLQAIYLAFFRVKLHTHDMIMLNGSSDLFSVIDRSRNMVRVVGPEIVAVIEIEMMFVVKALKQRLGFRNING